VKLAALFPEDKVGAPIADVEISAVTADSRKAKPGSLFFALSGAKADGAHFAQAAVNAGAVAAAGEQGLPGLGVPFLKVANARRALALAAAKIYPHQPGTIAAITGTSGKTSVASFLRQIWQALGHNAASIGTIGVVTPKAEEYG